MKRKSFLAALTFLPAIKAIGERGVPFVAESCRTQKDAEGPFYKKGAPTRAVIEEEGEKLTIRGRILKASDCATPVANATIDIWHCDVNGNYDNDGFKCRAIVMTNEGGNYSFSTILPPPYGSRPRHIHFKVRAKGFPELTSQIYFKGDKNIQNDFARNAEAARILDVQTRNGMLSGEFDIYV
jgi:protocatechuate 3,4-dioxygenase beta subunit